MPPRMNLADLAQRGAVTALVGMSLWGLWLTGAVWKSRRDDRNISGVLGHSPEVAKQQEQFRKQHEENMQNSNKWGDKIDPPPQNPS